MDEVAAASRFRTALAMAEVGVRLQRQNLRRRDRGASEAEVDERLRRWLADRPMDAIGSARVVSRR